MSDSPIRPLLEAGEESLRVSLLDPANDAVGNALISPEGRRTIEDVWPF